MGHTGRAVTSPHGLTGLQTSLWITCCALRCRSHPLGSPFPISRIDSLTAEHACAMHLPHLITKGFLFLTLFGVQHWVEIAVGFDPHEAQLGFKRFAVFDLGFDD